MTFAFSNSEAVAIFDSMSDGALVLRRDGTIRRCNAQAERLFRRKAAELESQAFWTLAADASTADAVETIERAMASGIAGRFEIFYPGLYAWHAVTVTPIETGAVLLIRDITDRMRMLRDEAVKQGIAEVIANIPVAISITRSADHRFELVNPFARELLGGRDVEGLTLRNAFPELADQGFAEVFDQVYQSGQPHRASAVPVRFLNANGDMREGRFDVVYCPLRDLNGAINGILSTSVEVGDAVASSRAQAAGPT